MPEKWKLWNFEDNLLAKGIIIRYTSKPERFFLFYFIILWLIFYISSMLEIKKNKEHEVSARANDANKHIDWLIFFLETVIGPGLDHDRLSCQMNSRNAS